MSVVINSPLTAYPSETIELSGTLTFDGGESLRRPCRPRRSSQDGVPRSHMWAMRPWPRTKPGASRRTRRRRHRVLRATYDGSCSVRERPRDDAAAGGAPTDGPDDRRQQAEPTLGQMVTLTARIDLLPGTTRRRVAFRFEPLNKPAVALGELLANDNGVARITVRARAIGNYFATYAGDVGTRPTRRRCTSPRRRRIVTRMGGQYGVSGAYRLFHDGVVPAYGVAVAPERRWSVHFVLQRFRDGRWRSPGRVSFPRTRTESSSS